jgi:pimeloyl-ACP methyl ester carboxylesterase
MSSPSTLTIALVLLASSQALAQLRLNDCRVSGEPIRCGTLRVPENRAISAGRQLVLSIVLAPHSASAESKEPVFILKGGPGERATAALEHTLGLFRPLRGDHDLVLLDQRGSGGENPLRCDVADHTFLVPRDPERCLRELSAKADLRQYTTEHFVQDLDAAREALGYEQISLWAASYGTRAAYLYAKRYPQRVRSLVLIAAAPMTMPVLDTFDQEGRIALGALIADCRADRACAAAFPNLPNWTCREFATVCSAPSNSLGFNSYSILRKHPD